MTEGQDPTGEHPARYKPRPLFRMGALLLAAGGIYLGSDVWQDPQLISAILFAGVALIAFWMGLHAFAVASFDGEALTYRVPLRGTKRIDVAQIDSISIEGRRTRALVILYHTRTAAGTIDGKTLRFLNLVPLENQDELFDCLGGYEEEDGDA